MPTYDYHCKTCKEDIEIFHSMSAPPVEVCPSCNKPGLKRLISSGAGIIFKGSGFYETDYKRKPSSSEESSKSSCESGSGKSSSTETAKPAATAGSEK